MRTSMCSRTGSVARAGAVALTVTAGLAGGPTIPIATAEPGQTVSSYVWPTEASPEPKEDAWAKATELETKRVKMPDRWFGGGAEIECTQRVVREWVRVTCTPPHDKPEDTLVGVIWGMAGDLDSVSGDFEMSAELPRYAKPPQNVVEDLSRKMGASATITFQARAGSAMLLSLDEIGWDESYDGSNVFSRSGILVDVSWALGENGPTILYR